MQAARTSSNLRQSGYNNSLNAAMQDRNFRSGIQSGLLGDQYRNLGLLSGIGTQQQGLQQAGMDAGYNEFLRALGYGPQQLGLLQGAVHGMTPAFNNTTSNQRDSFTRLSDGINAYNAVKGFFPTTG